MESSSLDFLKEHKKEEDQAREGGMSKLSKKGGIKNLESAIRHHMGRMDQLSDAYEGDENPHPQTFGMGVTILVNNILKPYYLQLLTLDFMGFKLWVGK